MRRRILHLVDENQDPVEPAIAAAVEAAYHWAVVIFPHVDPAMLANAAEELAAKMEHDKAHLGSPRRYAYAAMRGKVRDWLRTKPANERHSGLDYGVAGHTRVANSWDSIDRSILFQQLKRALNARDRYILVMITEQDARPKDVAAHLGISYKAASKAIQRLRERIAACLEIATESNKAQNASLTAKRAKGWI